jgi:predicted phosphate transport protein (TIGR00153 family)
LEARMLGWLQALMPKEDKFFDLFERHARITLECAKVLRAILDGGDRVPDLCEAVIRHENQADEVAAEVQQALRRSFITPFDRSDIHALISDMDDAIDQMRQTVKAISLFDVVAFDDNMKAIGDLIIKSAEVSCDTLPLLRAMNANAVKINQGVEKIIELEEQSDHLYILGLKDLFRAHKEADPMGYIVGSEIYSHLEKVVDYFEDVADRMSGILLEHL